MINQQKQVSSVTFNSDGDGDEIENFFMLFYVSVGFHVQF